ncbi:MAG: biotin--[acetyl-CoA-carboxylase] ligase [Anaerovoracaceae bacterium]
MSTKSELLKILIKNKTTYLSGQGLASELNVSRNAIWKAVEQLRSSGYDIESKPRVGYKISGDIDIITVDGIRQLLSAPYNIQVFETVDSTNNVAKSIPLESTPAIIISNMQTAGRGRLGRDFYSPANSGIYMSIVFKPEFDLNKSMSITMATAVAVCKAIEKVTQTHPKIKWVNDVFLNDKKICGILTEGQTNFETGKIDSLIVGIGVNCFTDDFPSELDGVAGSLSTDKVAFVRNVLAAEIVNQFFAILPDMSTKQFLREYRNHCFILGKSIMIHQNINGKAVKGRAIDIDDNGGLIVEYLEGSMYKQMATLTTGEVSIRLER